MSVDDAGNPVREPMTEEHRMFVVMAALAVVLVLGIIAAITVAHMSRVREDHRYYEACVNNGGTLVDEQCVKGEVQ